MIRVQPDYFALPEAERENYRLQLNTEDDFRIRQTFLKELFGIAVNTTEELDAILDTFDDSQYLSLNSTLLPLQGIGEDNFFLNEYLPVEWLIGTIRREFLDHTLFWNATDLERKLETFRQYYNTHRAHSSLDGDTPSEITSETVIRHADLNNFQWRSYCRELFQLPAAA